jgi:ribosomal protein S18 acetylase RimI-like enzyme
MSDRCRSVGIRAGTDRFAAVIALGDVGCDDGTMTKAVHATAADLPQLVDTLASAFHDDPLTNWIFSDEAERPRQLQEWMRFSCEMGLTRGHFYSAGGHKAAAIWSPPDVNLFDDLWGPRVAQLLQRELGERAGSVIAGLARAMDTPHATEPHFYLFTLGTHADHQGGGLGAQVLEDVLAICDKQGLPAHLESSNIRNVPFYQRHGFEVVSEIEVDTGGPVLRPMRRAPRTR